MYALSTTREVLKGRSQVVRNAPQQAITADDAHQIADPWCRCRLLALCAERRSSEERLPLIDAALAAARELESPNRIVSVATWPIRVLAGTAPGRCADEIRRLIATAETEPHHLRRADALQLLAAATADFPPLLAMIAPALVEALLGGRGTRIDRCIHDTFDLVAMTHPELLPALARHHRAGERQTRLLAKALVVQQTLSSDGRGVPEA